MEIKGLAAVVTAGATGMGAASASALAAKGAKVTVLSRRIEAAEAKAAEIGGLGLACDITKPDEVSAAFDAAERAHGPARICINAVGDGRPATILLPDGNPFPHHAFAELVNVNLMGVFYVAQAFAARLVKAPPLPGDDGTRGVLINVSSTSAEDGMIGVGYMAAKAGVNAMTLSLAREFAPWGIRVMTIVPGPINTEMMRANAGPESLAFEKEAYVHPKRQGNVLEFAALAIHIIENDFLNGSNIRLDGGAHVHFIGKPVKNPDALLETF